MVDYRGIQLVVAGSEPRTSSAEHVLEPPNHHGSLKLRRFHLAFIISIGEWFTAVVVAQR